MISYVLGAQATSPQAWRRGRTEDEAVKVGEVVRANLGDVGPGDGILLLEDLLGQRLGDLVERHLGAGGLCAGDNLLGEPVEKSMMSNYPLLPPFPLVCWERVSG